MPVIRAKYLYRSLLAAGLYLVSCNNIIAQYEYMASFDYQTLQLTRLNHIPGVTRVIQDNSTYDENNQRFFFQGNGSGAPPFQLFTVSAITGAALYNPVCPSGNQGQVFGLQFDNFSNRLYAVYNNKGSVYFSWIDPATGDVHPISPIPSFVNYMESCFDKKNRWYICHQASELIIIEAATGNILFRNNLPFAVNMTNLVFNNASSKLYGLCYSSSWANPQFDSISVNTGAVHFITNLPAMSFPQVNTNAIDELNGRYIFVGKESSSNCIDNYLYQLDVNSGNVLSKKLYPFAQNTGSPFNENAIEFSYDNKANKIFTLNWHPPDSTVSPLIAIQLSPEKICMGSAATFTALLWDGITNPSFQWQLNGTNTGTDTAVLVTTNVNAGDSIRCILTDHSPCAITTSDTSNSIAIHFTQPDVVTVNIQASQNPVCKGSEVDFTATPSMAAPFAYSWQINGQPAGSNSNQLVLDDLSDKGIVRCLVFSNSACVLANPAISNTIQMQVIENAAAVVISADKTTICQNDTVTFTAMGQNKGDNPAYHWQVNGITGGKNNKTFVASGLKNGDIVNCIMTSSIACSQPAASNSISITVNELPTLVMGNDTVIAAGQRVNLHPVVTGSIASYSWAPAQGLDHTDIPFPVAMPDKTTDYLLTVTTTKGCAASGKIRIVVYSPLHLPNAFTPNGNGKNDVFEIPPLPARQIKYFTIYNRYGQRVFSTNDGKRGWNGRFKGILQPEGAYVWVIAYINEFNNRTVTASGIVLLIK